MSDQVQRLRDTAKFVTHATGAEHARWINEAADEIELLQRQLLEARNLVKVEHKIAEESREQLDSAMMWEVADLLNIDTTAYYLVKDNGGEWRDFDLHIMNGRMVAHKLHPDYVRGRPLWIAKINPPAALSADQT